LATGLLAIIVLALPGTARAVNVTCANADYLFPGQMGSYPTGDDGTLFFKTRVETGRSYAVYAWAPFQDAGEGAVGLDMTLYDTSTCTTTPAGVNSVEVDFLVDVDAHNGEIEYLRAEYTGTLYIRVDEIGPSAAGYTFQVLVVETTLYSPWWYVGGTNQAFMEVRNNTSGTRSATATFFGANGAVCGTSTLVIPANGNTAVNIKSVGTCAGTVFGSARISHDAGIGGMVANITSIDGVQGTSFDSPFTVRNPALFNR
jgi:hypothetical protein